MTHRTHAVAKTRAHQVRWSSRCRSRTAGAGAGAAAGARGAAAAGRGRTTQLRLSSASTLVNGSPQLQRSNHALLRPQESKCSITQDLTYLRLSISIVINSEGTLNLLKIAILKHLNATLISAKSSLMPVSIDVE
ncbi:hypothetical protein ALC53_07679 [Atta colombica]|uniref:Uncharacterized protein n=1 Tax=Atta colombica TaxID=520822 RepID=A0A195BCE0_9HYME|nr:hypothetical protein ALC53_07679 [Atta colombica]